MSELAARARAGAAGQRGPIVAPGPAAGEYDVTFVFHDRTGKVRSAALVCPAVPGGVAAMVALGESTFTATVTLCAGTRVKYHFCPDPVPGADPFDLVYSLTQRRLDPFNPSYDQIRIPSLRARICDSLLALPGAPADPRPGRGSREPRHGSARTEARHSPVLGTTKTVTVYRPHADPRGRALVVLTGADEWGDPALLFDDLQGLGTPFTGIAVGAQRYAVHLRDLGRQDGRWGRFVAGELLPATAPDARGCAIAGFSAAAVGALTAACERPDVVGPAILVSGAFHLTERMEVLRRADAVEDAGARVRAAGAVPASAYLAAGRFEDPGSASDFSASAQVAAALRERGARVRLDSGPTGHDTVSARVYLEEAVRWWCAADPPRRGDPPPRRCIDV
jgi:Putative esterase